MFLLHGKEFSWRVKGLSSITTGRAMHTPFFPPFRARLAALGRRVQHLRQQSLCHLELLLAPFLPPGLLSQADEGPNSRERVFSVRRTFFGFLYQVLNPKCPCRGIVRQLQALFALQDQGRVDEGTSAYCQARNRLPLDTLQRLRVAVAAAGEQCARLWHGLRPKVIDGTTTSLPDTPKNQRAYPQSASQKPGCGFPLLRLVGVFSLATGVLLDYAKGNKHQAELPLLKGLLDQFKPGDLALADRGFCSYVLLALLLLRNVLAVFRLHQARPADLRKGQRLGKNDRLFTWQKPAQKPRWLPQSWWKKIPEERSEEHTSELQSPYVISYAVFCLKNKEYHTRHRTDHPPCGLHPTPASRATMATVVPVPCWAPECPGSLSRVFCFFVF